MSVWQKLLRLNWLLLALIIVISIVGFAMLYSVAGESLNPYAKAQMIRFSVALVGLFVIALINIRFWRWIAYVLYAVGIVLLMLVLQFGEVHKGAQRWIDLGFINLQPSEVMKIFLIITLARYYHDLKPENTSRPLYLLIPFVLILIPMALIREQPDLGTALLVGINGLAMMFAAGVSWWLFGLVGVGSLGAAYAVWISQGTSWQILKDYQFQRIETFLNAAENSLGDGYHITQSKIAFGSGGMWGKGFGDGPQSYLNFLPEKHTDFIFTTLAEEFGFAGSITLLALYMLVVLLILISSIRVRHVFGRLLIIGVGMNFFLYFAANMAMVMGLMPVVGIPLPLVSYGGTSLLSLMASMGLLLSAQIHRQTDFKRSPLE